MKWSECNQPHKHAPIIFTPICSSVTVSFILIVFAVNFQQLITSFIMCICVCTSQRMLATLRCVWEIFPIYYCLCMSSFFEASICFLWPTFPKLSTFSNIQRGAMLGPVLLYHTFPTCIVTCGLGRGLKFCLRGRKQVRNYPYLELK